MSEPQRQHPAAAVINLLDTIRDNVITLLLILFFGIGDTTIYNLLFIFGVIFCLLCWGIIHWYRFTYQIQNGELRIEKGIINREKVYISSNRIQVIDISAGMVERIFNLVTLEVKTAGSTSKEAKINAIRKCEAEKIKNRLREDASQTSRYAAGQAKKPKIYTLATKDLLLAATTSGRLGLLFSMVAAVYSQVDQILPHEKVIRFVKNSWPGSTSIALIVLLAAVLLFISWLISFGYTIVKYYDFSVEVRDDEILISRGLLERIQLTIPYDRIQAIEIKEELLRQPFGYASLMIESAGYSKEKGNARTLFPLIAKAEMHEFIKQVIPEYYTVAEKDTSNAIPGTGLRRYLLRMGWKTLPVVILSWIAIPGGVFAWFLLIPALLLGYQQYKDAAVRIYDNDTIILSYRRLSKKTAIVKKKRVQAVELHRNPFQTRLQLCDLSIYVASGNSKRSFKVRELAEQTAFRYWQWCLQKHS